MAKRQLRPITGIGAFACSAMALSIFARHAAAELRVEKLLCERWERPQEVDVLQPALSWVLQSDQRGERGAAYQVLVASSPEILQKDEGDVWDSGKHQADDVNRAIFAGKALESGAACWWKVRVWNTAGVASAWSAPATWSTGLLDAAAWKAHWIMAPIAETEPTTAPTAINDRMPIFRKAFQIGKKIQRATVSICGLGQFELHVNGQKVSDDVLQPGWTDYRKTCLYVDYDVTSMLKNGGNALGVLLGNGMYNIPIRKNRYTKFKGSFGPPMLIAQIKIEYADGTSETLGSDEGWKTTPGPITFSSIYGGEDFDARLEPAGWDRDGFDDTHWEAAMLTDWPGGELRGDSRSAPPVRVMQVFTPQKITEPKPGVFVFDVGQNCSMIPRLSVRGEAGAAVHLVPGEFLNADGTVSQSSSGGPASFNYTLSGQGGDAGEEWSPRFSYYGSRYFQVSGAVPSDRPNADNLPQILKLEGAFISSTAAPAGEFSCSNDLFNRTANIIRWAMRSNMVSLLTDCPHRERLGWLEQDHLVGPSLMYNFDVQTLFGKICGDIQDAQTAEGLVPDIAPEYTKFAGGFRDSPEWGSACVLIPWQVYQWYGDEKILRDQYDVMKRYVAYLGTKATNHIVSHGLGDWYDIGPKPAGKAQLTPPTLTATAFYYRDITVLEKVARLLNQDDDAAAFASLAQDVRTAFNNSLYDAAAHTYATGSQTSNALPLVFGLAPEEDRAAIVENLVADIRKHDNGLTAGDVGYRYLLKALADAGRSDVIFDMNSRSDRPGYGMILAKGNTSLTESWTGTNSRDHFMLGHIMEWFYADLAGIQCDPDAVGFRKIVINPTPVGDVTWATASLECPYGKIASTWKKAAGTFTLDVMIPVGASAMVYVATSEPSSVTEGGGSPLQASGVKFLRVDQGRAIYSIESGHYQFKASLP